MSIKIFVTGFSNSGTSLTRRLIEAHPDVRIMLHEKYILNHISIGAKMKFDIDAFNWGEKIPFIHKKLKRFNDRTIVDYANVWKNFFEPDYRIIWVIRHPTDVIVGNLKWKKLSFVKDPEMRIPRLVGKYKTIMPIVFKGIFGNTKCLCVKFEDILLNTEQTLERMFNFISINSGKSVVSKVMYAKWGAKRDRYVNAARAFGYGDNSVPGYIVEHFSDIDKEIEFINDAVGGIPYKT